jgi:hypothetical protein
MIARFAEPIDRRRTAGACALFAALDARLDPTVAMELQELLTNGFAGQTEGVGELRDRRRTTLFECRENRAPAIR